MIIGLDYGVPKAQHGKSGWNVKMSNGRYFSASISFDATVHTMTIFLLEWHAYKARRFYVLLSGLEWQAGGHHFENDSVGYLILEK